MKIVCCSEGEWLEDRQCEGTGLVSLWRWKKKKRKRMMMFFQQEKRKGKKKSDPLSGQ